MCDHMYTFSAPVQYWIHNFQGTMFYQTNVSASIIDMYMQKCTPFPIVLYKTPQKKNKKGAVLLQ